MAEAALLGIANSLLGKLSSPAVKEALLLWKYDKDLDSLRRTMGTIKASLLDAERRESQDHLVKDLLSNLRSILYEADDLFDAVAADALAKKAMPGPANALKQKVCVFFAKFKRAHDIKDIKKRLDDITKNMCLLSLQSLKIEENFPTMNPSRETHSFADVNEIIGRDKEKEEIISLLLSEQAGYRNVSVISIIGFGGLGKTTLAQLVYDDDRVQKTGFDFCLWTCINRFSDLKSVLVSILTSALGSKPQDMDLDQLQRKLRNFIGGKKILLVLDDVWEEDASEWAKLKTLLISCVKSGSKVLATTRNTRVAQCLESMKFQLNVLSEDHALSLFEKMAFDDNHESTNDHTELVPLGLEIVRKCGGVPLALTIVGRLLRSNKDVQLWSSFIEKELPNIFGDNGKLTEVLKLSYNYLPPAFKSCFAYCSLFPKDHEFDKDELVRMWVAQGFLEPGAKKSKEEVGDECFFYMVDRCLFQQMKMVNIANGKVRYTCKMHDLLHDLAIQVAGLESGCFNMEGDLGDMVEGRTLRHISASWNPNHFALSSPSKTLRTLLLNSSFIQFESSLLKSILSRFRVLRVLRLSHFSFDKLPDNSFRGMIHLRYLDLSGNRELTALPKSVCKLHHLQTLVLLHCESLVKLPKGLGKLGSLRHLLLDGCDVLNSLPQGFEALTALVTLDRFPVHQRNGGLRYLGRLDDLSGRLNIELPVNGWSDCIEDAQNANMSRKQKLNGMTIKWIDCGEIANEETEAAVDALTPHQNLQYLKIEGHVGDKLSSWVLSLSKLKEIVLEGCTKLEYLEDNLRFDSFLPCLEILTLSHLPNLKGWWRGVASLADNGPMSVLPSLPRVAKVYINECPKLIESMPLFGGIETLKLWSVSGEVVTKLISNPNMSCSSSELHHYSKLKKLTISKVDGIRCWPKDQIKFLTSLETLKIEFCPNLRWVSADGLAYLTALQKLDILVEDRVDIVDKDDVKMGIDNDQLGMPWKALGRLRHLEISWQKHLLQDGLQYLTALEKLCIGYYGTQQIEADNECGGIMLWRDLKRLRTIQTDYSGIGDEDTGRCCFPPKWIQYLSSLKELAFRGPKLHMSWTTLANLSTNLKLERLSFHDVEKVVTVDEMVAEQQSQFNSIATLFFSGSEDGSWLHEFPWNLFPSLPTLFIRFIKKMGSIPDGIQHLTSLQYLEMGFCGGITIINIPEWIVNLKFLGELHIENWTSEIEKS